MCIMLDKFWCTVVQPWNLHLQMRQHYIGWSVVWYIFTIYVYISHIIIYRICSKHKVSLTWDLKPIPLDLCSDPCSTELASLTQERSSAVNFYTRSHIKEHKVVPEFWQLSRSKPHLRNFSILHNVILTSTSFLFRLLHSPFLWG